MIIIKSEAELALMREAGKVTGQVLKDLENFIKPGISTLDIDKFVESEIRRNKMLPSFKGLYGFPASACISCNEEIIHGIPKKNKILKEGDIVSVDIGATYKGYVSDAARTYPVGKISDKATNLIEATKASFFAGLEFCKEGYRLSDISHAIQVAVESKGYSVVVDFTGHGVGRDMHEDPQIPNYGPPGRGPRLAAGMVLAIEPMVNEGTHEVVGLSDDWTYVTADDKLSAHYENTVAITSGEPEVFTLAR